MNRIANGVLAVALLVAVLLGGFGMAPNHADAARDPGVLKVPIAASAARTATGTSSTFCGLGEYTKYAMQLVVSAHAGTTPTLDLTWQHSIDSGTTWFTVATFTQVTTTDGNQLKVVSEVEAATASVWGDCMRASWVIAGTTPSYTFSIALFAE